MAKKTNGMNTAITVLLSLIVVVGAVFGGIAIYKHRSIEPPKCTHEKTVTDAAVAATCTKTGVSAGSHCKDCGEIIKKQELVPALGHHFVDGVCSRCGESEQTKPDNPDTPNKPTPPEVTGTPIFPNVTSAATSANIFETGHSGVSSFSYVNQPNLKGKTITAIGLPVLSLSDCTKDCTFHFATYTTGYVLYTLTIPANTFENNTVKDWYYFTGLNIEIGNNDTLLFGFGNDTVNVLYTLDKSESKYNFCKNNSGILGDEVLGTMYIDIYTK